MGSRDHSITCETCGLQRGGLNNYQCDCDSVIAGNPESVIPQSGSITEEHMRCIILKLKEAALESVTPEGDSPTVDQIDRVVQRVQDSPPEGFSPQHRAWLHELQQLQAARRATEADALTTLARFRRTVICVWCGNRYRSACPDDLDRGLQGSHCASDVVQKDGAWYVRGGYGSDEHDMHRYLFVANPPTAPADPVCDECISERLLVGDLQDTGLEVERRPADFGPRPFGPRPFGTWGLVHQIRELAQNEVALRRLAEVTCQEHETVHPPDVPVESCAVCTAIRGLRKSQRWRGELEDGGEEYAEGCTEVAAHLRTAAHRLGELAAAWERERPRLEAIEGTANEASPPNESGECPHCQAQEPSVWDDVLLHFAHPAEIGLKMCLSPWRTRCRRCSADVAQEQGEFCTQHGGMISMPETCTVCGVATSYRCLFCLRPRCSARQCFEHHRCPDETLHDH